MKKVATALAVSLVTIGCLAKPAIAMPSEAVITANCQTAQTVLNQIEKTDAALRINRGRVYNEVLDLFYAMNARLASNKISAADLVSITSEFEQALTDFRNDYNDYDDRLGELIDIKCQDKPTDFYDTLVDVRDLRSKLDDGVAKLDQLVDDYWSEFDDNVRAVIDAK